jgi:hypothetical protein
VARVAVDAAHGLQQVRNLQRALAVGAQRPVGLSLERIGDGVVQQRGVRVQEAPLRSRIGQ